MIGAIILGLVAGFIGRALMPGRDPLGFFATILLGIGDNEAFDLGGLIGAVIGVMILLGLYRVVAGRRGSTPAARMR
jgi:uncharacterized membrane protein YeaQ/YmgE (transglycosylase-associated protein family)